MGEGARELVRAGVGRGHGLEARRQEDRELSGAASHVERVSGVGAFVRERVGQRGWVSRPVARISLAAIEEVIVEIGHIGRGMLRKSPRNSAIGRLA